MTKFKVTRDGCLTTATSQSSAFGLTGIAYFVDLSNPSVPVLRALNPSGGQRWQQNLTGTTNIAQWKLAVGGDGNLYAYVQEFGYSPPILYVLNPHTGAEVVPRNSTSAPRAGFADVVQVVPTSDGVAFGTVNEAIYLSRGLAVATTRASGNFPSWDWGLDDTALAATSGPTHLSCTVVIDKIRRADKQWSVSRTAPFSQCGSRTVTALPNGGAFVAVAEADATEQRTWIARLDASGTTTWNKVVNGEALQSRDGQAALGPIADESGNVLLFAFDRQPCTTQYKFCFGLRVIEASSSGAVRSTVYRDPEPGSLSTAYFGSPVLKSGELLLPWATKDVLNPTSADKYREDRIQVDAGSSFRDLRRWNVLNGTPIPVPEKKLVALGDSFSSGHGAFTYDAEHPDCKRSNDAWPRLMARDSSDYALAGFFPCSGALIDSLQESSPKPSVPPQLTDLAALVQYGGPDMVTITIGGNDLDFAGVLTECVAFVACGEPLRGAIASARLKLPEVRNELESALSTLRARVPTRTRIVLVGYPRLLPLSWADASGNCIWLDIFEHEGLNDLSADMDRIWSEAADSVGVEYASTSAASEGHELCSSDSWIVSPNVGLNRDTGHPTVEGQQAIADMVRAELGLE